MGKLDERGQLYEAHTLLSGEVVWLYSDKLHNYFHFARLYGLDIYKPSEFVKVQIIMKKTKLNQITPEEILQLLI
jgi:hypothetical protein